jgi:hypothetical protein
MKLQKTAEHGDELGRVLHFASVKALVDVIDDHGADAIGPIRLVEQVARQGSGRNLAHMLMLADRDHLVRLQAAHCNAVF